MCEKEWFVDRQTVRDIGYPEGQVGVLEKIDKIVIFFILYRVPIILYNIYN